MKSASRAARILFSLFLSLLVSSIYYAPPLLTSPRANMTAYTLDPRTNTDPDPCTNAALQKGKLTFCRQNRLRPHSGHPTTSARRLICRLAQNRRKIKEEDKRAGAAAAALVKPASNGGRGLSRPAPARPKKTRQIYLVAHRILCRRAAVLSYSLYLAKISRIQHST